MLRVYHYLMAKAQRYSKPKHYQWYLTIYSFARTSSAPLTETSPGLFSFSA
jgi:hypothetical protein